MENNAKNNRAKDKPVYVTDSCHERYIEILCSAKDSMGYDLVTMCPDRADATKYLLVFKLKNPCKCDANLSELEMKNVCQRIHKKV